MTRAWLCDSLQRVFPSSTPRRARLCLDVARGETFSFQLAVIPESPLVLSAVVTADSGLTARVRRVGYVPLPRRSPVATPRNTEGYHVIPGLVPDPLFEDFSEPLPPTTASAYWVSGAVAPDCRPGLKRVRVVLSAPNAGGKEEVALSADIRVHPVRLQPRRDFDVTHWLYADALCDWYKTDPWTARFWQIVQPYMRDLVSHGQNVISVPLFTPPLDGVKRPTQLLGVRRTGRNAYAFDWTQVLRWIRTARRCGFEKFEWYHLFSQWGAEHAIRIYRKQRGEDILLWPPETSASGATYRAFLAQLLPEMHQFLSRERLLDRSLFHLSDEPHGDRHLENYRKARALLRELAPWMKVMDALSDIRFAREHLVDMPIPSLHVARQFWKEQIPCWHYFAGGGKNYLSRRLETPLAVIRMSGWLLHRFQARGFLHWGYNYWYQSQTRNLIDPFHESAGATPGWTHGGPFVVYPGPDGPLDSIRWEVFAESLQDYQLLQTLDIPPSAFAGELRDYNRFPMSADWIRRHRRRLLETATVTAGGHHGQNR